VFENVAELTGEEIYLFVGQVEAGQTGDVFHVVSCDSFSHGHLARSWP
jgi:hypothetical protein